MIAEILKIELEWKEFLESLKLPAKKEEAILIKRLEIMQKYMQIYKRFD